MVEMALSIIVVSIPGLKPLLNRGSTVKRNPHDTPSPTEHFEQRKENMV